MVAGPFCALRETDRVCKKDGRLIIPTYMNEKKNGKTNGITNAIDKTGADFKREFTLSSYEQFFEDADYTDAEYIWCRAKCRAWWLCYTKKHDFRAASVFLRV